MGFGAMAGSSAARVASAIGNDLNSMLSTGETKDQSMDAIMSSAMYSVDQSDSQRKGVLDTVTSMLRRGNSKSAGMSR